MVWPRRGSGAGYAGSQEEKERLHSRPPGAPSGAPGQAPAGGHRHGHLVQTAGHRVNFCTLFNERRM